MSGPAVVESLRGDVVESRHLVHVVVCDADGELVAAAGDAARPTYLRSAAKPFQALPAVADGVLERFGLGERELAIGCASHDGSPAHAAAVASLLAAAGVPLGALRPRGLHDPLSPHEAVALHRAGRVVSPLEHNCAGNHALMLARARARGWPLESYLDPAGPLQLDAGAAVAAALATAPAAGVDRCGMTAYAAPLAALAAAYARLACGTLAEPWRPHGRRVRDAMRARPDLVAGAGSPDTEAMALPGVVAKRGASGLFCCGCETTGLGGALKVDDGDDEVAALVAPALVARVAGVPAGRLERADAYALLDGEGGPAGSWRVELVL